MRPLFRGFVRLFPAAFRERFGAAMVDHAAEDVARARRHGVASALACAFGHANDLAWSALAERRRPTWRPVIEGRRRPDMMGMVEAWAGDLRQAARTLRRTPVFTATAVATLGLAIGALAAIYTVLDGVLLDPLPYAHADRLVAIRATAPGSDLPEEFGVSNEFFVHYRERSRQLEDVAAYATFTATLRVGDRVERVRMGAVSSSLYSTLGARPALGRLPAADEADVVVLGDAVWHSWFGGDPAVVGRSYQIADAQRTVIGVMPPEFAFPEDGTLLWINTVMRLENLRPGRFGTALVARLAPAATPQSAARELTDLARALPERFGGSPAYAKVIERHRAVVRPLLDELLGPARRLLWVLFAAAGVVLVIACANVANLFLVRAETRQRDLALRRAIGATRGELVRVQLAEAVVAAGLAGALALVIARLGLPALLAAAPQRLPRLDSVEVGLATAGFALLAVLVTALACGLMPALRGASPDFQRLREGGRGATGRRGWTRDGLVVAQTALALVLLIGSGLLVRSFQALGRVDPGYDTRDVFTFQFAPDQPTLTDGPAWARFHLDFLDRLRALPGVRSVGLVENLPLNEETRSQRVRAEGTAPDDGGNLLHVNWTAGDYFEAMGIELLAGRAFETADHVAPGNVLVSRSAARLLWPGRDPVGQRLQPQGDETWHTVVGVVEDVMQSGFRDTPRANVYLPLVGPSPTSWRITSPAYVIQSARAETLAPEVRELVRAVAPEAPMYRAFTMEQLAADSMLQLSFTALTLGLVAALALILGTVGLYGVLAYVVAGRTREIGLRMALGASAAEVRRMVVAHGARVVGAGIGLGLLAAALSTRALEGLLFGVAALDAATFAAMSTLMLAIGLLASWVPATRASRVDPGVSLREE
ncbi:MAG: ABC transporter permease [Vicinamibacteria bacterium]|nr:ABC transporter permease [Vicinamibacteria bacterium]